MPTSEDIKILDLIRLDGNIEKLIAASRDDNVVVTLNNKEMTLTACLQEILRLISLRTDPTQARSIAAEEVAKLINGAPETLDTLKEIADALAESDNAIQGLVTLLGDKVDKVPGMGLSEANFTNEFRDIMLNQILKKSDVDTTLNKESDKPISNSAVAIAVAALQVLATSIQDGLMSKEDKLKLDTLNQNWVGENPPENMLNGDIFIQYIGDQSNA